jgi:hypothetical protein
MQTRQYEWYAINNTNPELDKVYKSYSSACSISINFCTFFLLGEIKTIIYQSAILFWEKTSTLHAAV